VMVETRCIPYTPTAAPEDRRDHHRELSTSGRFDAIEPSMEGPVATGGRQGRGHGLIATTNQPIWRILQQPGPPVCLRREKARRRELTQG